MAISSQLSPERIEQVMQPIYQRADKLMLYFTLGFFAFGLLIAPIYETWLAAIGVGGLCVSIVIVFNYLMPATFFARAATSAIFAIFVAQFIYQFHGLAEMHFWSFIMVTVLLLYQDWRVLLPAKLVIVIHHSVFAYLENNGMKEIYFTEKGSWNAYELIFHFLLAGIQVGVCMWWANNLKENTLRLAAAEDQILEQVEELNAKNAELEDKQMQIERANRNLERDVKNRTADLKSANEELQAQAEELRQNTEELHAMQEMLAKTNAELDGQLNAINQSNAVVVLKPDGTFLDCNQIFCDLTGYNRDELIGKPHKTLLYQEEFDAQAYANFLEKLKKGESHSGEFKRRKKDGSVLWLQATYAPVKNKAGEVEKIIKIAHSITEKKQNELELQKIKANLERAFKLANLTSWEFDYATQILSWDARHAEMMHMPHDMARSLPINDYVATYFHPEDAPTAAAAVEQTLGFTPETAKEFTFEYRFRLHGDTSENPNWRYALVTVKVEFDESGNLKKSIGTTQDITDRKEADKLFYTILENTPVPIIISRMSDGLVEYINEPLALMVGETKENLIGRTSPEFYVNLDDRKSLIEKVKQDGFVNNFEVRLKRKNGNHFWGLISLRTIMLRNEPHILGAILDISERKQAEDALKRSEKRFGAMAANVPGMIYQFMLTPDGRAAFPYVSPYSKDLFDLEPAQIMENPEVILSLVHPDDAPIYQMTLVESAQRLTPWSWEGRLILSNGTLKWVRAEAKPEKLKGDITLWNGILLDITEQKKQAEALAESEMRFKEMSANIPGMIYQARRDSKDSMTQMVFASAAAKTLLGVEPEELMQGKISIIDMLVPEDRQRFLNGVLLSFEHLLPIEIEVCAFKRDGTKTWLKINSKPMRLPNGGVVWNGVMLDINQQKLAEIEIQQANEELLAREEEIRQNADELAAINDELEETNRRIRQNEALLSSIIDNLPVALFVKDVQNSYRFLMMNRVAEQMFGVDRNNMVGKNVFDHFPKEQAQAFHEDDVEIMVTRQTRDIPIEPITSKTLGDIFVHTIKVPIYDKDGNPQMLLGISENITDRVKAEQALKDLSLVASKTDNAVIIASKEGKIEWVNEGFTRISGYTLEEAKGKKPGTLLQGPDTDPKTVQKIREGLRSKQSFSVEILNYTKTKVPYWLQLSITPVLDENGEVEKFIAIEADITERKAVEATMKDLSLVASKTDNAVIIASKEGLIEWVNEGFTRISGYTLEEAKGKKPGTLLQGPDTDPKTVQKIREGLRSKQSFSVEILNYTKTKVPYWLQLSITPVLDENGEVEKFIAIEADITERKAVEESIRQSQARLQDAMKIAGLAPWELDLRSQTFIGNDNTLEILGTTKEALGGYTISANDYIERFVHPDDRERMLLGMSESLSTKDPNFAQYEEQRIVRADGKITYLYISTRVQLGLNGQVERVFGTMQDITERKLVELERESRFERKRKHQQTLSALAKDESITGGQLNQALQKITEALADALQIERSSIWLNDAEFTKIVSIDLFERSKNTHSNGIELFAKDYPRYFEALKTESIIDAQFANFDPRTSEFRETYLSILGINSMLDVPIRRYGKVIGVICNEHTGAPRKWHDDEIEFVLAVTEMIALAMESHDRLEAIKRLEAKEVELKAINNQLSSTVNERTEALNQLKNTQNQLIRSEKMASLGQLIAGVAHEVNTPISAVKASARNIVRALPVVLTEVPMLLKDLAVDENALFLELVNQSIATSQELTTQEEREYRNQVMKVLNEHGIDNAFELAKELVEVRIIDNIEKYIPLFEHSASEEIIDKVYKLGQFKKNLDNISVAAEKTANVVKALKTYSHTQGGDKFVEAYLHENLDTILTVYHNQLKYGISVERNFAQLRPVQIYPDEIGQVWTNIINNAVQAMKGKGKIKIDIFEQDGYACVRIADNGPGIPPDILPRIFEPFFTTKPQGEGTGLGLDICRKIVDKHNGKITVESNTAGTAFTVMLPFVQTTEQAKVPELN